MTERYTGGSIKDRIRRMVIDDETIDTKRIIERLSRDLKGGGSRLEMPSEMLVDSVRNDTRQTVRLLRDMGHIKSR